MVGPTNSVVFAIDVINRRPTSLVQCIGGRLRPVRLCDSTRTKVLAGVNELRREVAFAADLGGAHFDGAFLVGGPANDLVALASLCPVDHFGSPESAKYRLRCRGQVAQPRPFPSLTAADPNNAYPQFAGRPGKGGGGKKRADLFPPDRPLKSFISQTHKTPALDHDRTKPRDVPPCARPPAHARATVILPPDLRKFVNRLAARRAERFETDEANRLKETARRLLDANLTPVEVTARLVGHD